MDENMNRSFDEKKTEVPSDRAPACPAPQGDASSFTSPRPDYTQSRPVNPLPPQQGYGQNVPPQNYGQPIRPQTPPPASGCYTYNNAAPQYGRPMQGQPYSAGYTQQQQNVPGASQVTYYPSSQGPQKKKHTWLRVTAVVVCIALISCMSIGAYIGVTGGANYVYENNHLTNEVTSAPSDKNTDDKTVPSDKTESSKTEKPDSSDKQAASSESGDKTAVRTDSVSIYQAAALEDALSIPEIVTKVTPSVVGISSEFVIGNMTGTGTGTGIVMSKDGYIITNAHVIENTDYGASILAKSIMVLMNDQTEYDAEIIGYDSKTDLAILKIEADNLTAAEFGDSSTLQVGELAIAIGNPLSFELYGTVTGGLISGLNRTFSNESGKISLIQTSAPISPGNSGGPLVNSYGQVIGINSAKISGTGAEGIGFAIPINDAIPIIDDLINVGYVTGRPAIGISGEDISQLWARYYNIPMGINVRFISPDSGAERAGIQPGDIIIGINGQSITSMSELNAVKDTFAAGDTVTITVYRDGKDIDFEVTLSEATN